METELSCIYDTRQSFYGKAIVETTIKENIIDLLLYSYGTLVARITKTPSKARYLYFGQYSQTTTRHQKEFFKQNGLTDKEIKELFKNGKLEKVVD